MAKSFVYTEGWAPIGWKSQDDVWLVSVLPENPAFCGLLNAIFSRLGMFQVCRLQHNAVMTLSGEILLDRNSLGCHTIVAELPKSI